MKQATAGILAGSFAALALYQSTESSSLFQVAENDAIRGKFDEHIAEYGKSYGTKEEYEFRLAIFRENYIKIQEHNQRNTDDATWGVNFLTTWTADEFKRLKGFKNVSQVNHGRNMIQSGNTSDLPTSIDWRDQGAVTPVKNQGQCGSCWAFSSTGAMEGAYFLKNKELKSFSEQQLVDCSRAEGNLGCNGGLMDSAFTYVESHKIETEADYPYTGRDGSCHASGGVAELKSFSDVTPKDPEALATALQSGPVAIAVDAGITWQLYFGGIMKHFCGTSLDHGVLLVGYGTSDGEDYWLVKNSWGASWGEKGYTRIYRDMKSKGDGVCGIQMQPSQPAF